MENEKISSFDAVYLKTLFDDLADSNRGQAKTLSELATHVATINVSLENIAEKVSYHKERIDDHEKRIREVSKKQDSCNLSSQMKGAWYHINRLNAFKDMIADKASQDTGVIDLHAIRMEHEAEKARKAAETNFKGGILKYAPWFVIVFVAGVALATLFVTKVFTGNAIVDLPGIPSKTSVKQ